MYEQALSRAGLTPDQAKVYEILLKHGSLPAGDISRKSGLKRGLTYKVLDELAAMGLVERRNDSKILTFAAHHPLKLRELAEQKEKEAQHAQTAISGILGQLTSDFNLVSGKPGVRFFEGFSGIKEVANDSLTAKTAIYSYIDNEAVNKIIPDFNKGYVKQREKLGIKKRMISLDSEYIRKHARTFNPDITEVRVIKGATPFATVMQIYDNKVTYITLEKEIMIGVMIDNPDIAKMHKTLFEYTWDTAEPISP